MNLINCINKNKNKKTLKKKNQKLRIRSASSFASNKE